MVQALIAALVAAVPIPQECAAPPARDVSALRTYAQKSGALSVGLDSVATWCFDSSGTWTGGVKPTKKKPVVEPSAEPIGDCAKAIASCEGAKLAASADLRQLLSDAIEDLGKPFLGRTYTPKRSGLGEHPAEAADCRSTTRSELFSQAQARMDLARLSSIAQNEYANFRTWLFAESLKCANAVARAKTDPMRKGISVDAPVGGPDKGEQVLPRIDGGPAAIAAAQDGGREPAAGSTSALATSPRDAGSGAGKAPVAGTTTAGTTTTGTTTTATATTGTTSGTANTGTTTTGTTTTGTVTTGTTLTGTAMTGTAISGTTITSTGAGVDAGTTPVSSKLVASAGTDVLGGPTADRERALASPLLEKWRYFVAQRAKCEQDRDYTLGFMASRELRDCRCARLHPSEVVRRIEANDNLPGLQADDEKNTRCEVCLLDSFASWRLRATKQCALMDKLSPFELGVLERSDDGNGLPPRCFDAVRGKRSDAGVALKSPVATAPVKATGVKTDPPAGGSGVTGNAVVGSMVSSPLADSFVKAQDYAPVPMREDGRLYVRIFMSSACVADVQPGPIQARTGDLVLIPYNSRSLSVKSPCGGLAEVYWGREQKPRVSEIFARNQPLQLQFKPQ